MGDLASMTRRAPSARLSGAGTSKIHDLRSRLAAAPQLGAAGSDAWEPRSAGQTVGRLVSTQLDEHWTVAESAGSGPIDVIDVFSGCGGMSTGFLAVNGLVAAYRLVAAVDIDDIANRTYADNLRT